MLHAPCSKLQGGKEGTKENSRWTTDRQSFFFPTPTAPHRTACRQTVVTASSLLLPAVVPSCLSCSRRPQELLQVLYSTPYMYSSYTHSRQTALICASLVWLCTLESSLSSNSPTTCSTATSCLSPFQSLLPSALHSPHPPHLYPFLLDPSRRSPMSVFYYPGPAVELETTYIQMHATPRPLPPPPQSS